MAFWSELVITCGRRAVITFVNPSARARLGYELRELVGQPWALIVCDDDCERQLAQIQADFAKRGAALPVQTRYLTKRGEERLFYAASLAAELRRWQCAGPGPGVSMRPELVVEFSFDHASGGRIPHGARPLLRRDDKAPHECRHVEELER